MALGVIFNVATYSVSFKTGAASKFLAAFVRAKTALLNPCASPAMSKVYVWLCNQKACLPGNFIYTGMLAIGNALMSLEFSVSMMP